MKLFVEDELNTKFARDGYLKLNLIDTSIAKKLSLFYDEMNFDNKIQNGFHISLDNNDTEKLNKVEEKLKKELLPSVSKIAKDFKVFTTSFVVKEPGKKNIVPPHQDWSFVDETKYCSATIWIPLQDVNEENGALGVIPGSHKLFDYPRSSPSPQSKSPLSDHIFTLFPYTQIVPLKVGECLIFDTRLIHASPPNLTDLPRIAVCLGITDKAADLIHYYQNPKSNGKELLRYKVENNFFNYYNNKRLSALFDKGEFPDLEISEKISRTVPEFNEAEMKQNVQKLDGVEFNTEFMKRLAELFGYDYPKKDKELKLEENSELEIEEWEDARTFFQKYTMGNIVKEIIWRLKGKPV
jgi:hypothetical protein